MGRKKIIEQPGMVEKITTLYAAYQNAEIVGTKLNISGKTIRKYLKELNLIHKRGRRKGVTYATAKRSDVHKWIKENTTTPIPHSITDAAKLMGVSNDALKSYLYRRKKKYETFLHSIGPLNKIDFVAHTKSNTTIPLKALKEYEITKISPSGLITLKGTLYNNATELLTFRVSNLLKCLKENHPATEEPKQTRQGQKKCPPGSTSLPLS